MRNFISLEKPWDRFFSPSSDQRVANRLKAEQFSSIGRYTPGLLLANICNATALSAAFWGTPRFTQALFWATVIFSFAGYIYSTRRFPSAERVRGKCNATFRNATLRAVLTALGLGTCWAALPLFFFQQVSPGLQALIACLSAGMLCGGAFALASMPLAAMSFVGPIAAASLAALISSGERAYLFTALALFVYAAAMIRGVFIYGEQLKDRVMLQITTEEEARQRILSINEMTSSIAHEVNQPLSAATTYLHTTLKLMRLDPDHRTAKPEDVLEQALAQIKRASQIVASLRNFFGGGYDAASLHLHPLIEETCNQLESAASASGTDLRLHLDARSDTIFADKAHIGQVLANLILNAIDATENSFERRVTVSTSITNDGSIKTEVCDTGRGVAAAVTEDLFAPFTTTKKNGVGIGLAISRSIIETHAGKIWAEPGPEGGAKFCFILPLAPSCLKGGRH